MRLILSIWVWILFITFLILMFLLWHPHFAQASDKIVLYPTIPGSANFRDLTAPRIIYKHNKFYPTIPGSNWRDYRRPVYIKQFDMKEKIKRYDNWIDGPEHRAYEPMQ